MQPHGPIPGSAASSRGSSLRTQVPIFAAALWWGSLTTTGFVVVPVLFAHLATPALAGQTAARLFTAQTWITLGCGLLLLMAARGGGGSTRMEGAGGSLIFVLAGVLLALLVEFAVAPRIIARENLRLWHSAGTAMYVLEWICAGVVLWKLARIRSGGSS
jgi:hypothetical protein